MVPQRRSAHDVTYQAEAGPPSWLLVRKRGGAPVVVRAWLLAENSPGFRWELWEAAVKAWARAPTSSPPPAPATGAERLTRQLDFVRQALAAAPGSAADDGATAALLTASALRLDLPYREPIFPFFSRREVTVVSALPTVATPRGNAWRVAAGAPALFDVEGPGLLRVDAQALAPVAHRVRGPFDLLLEEAERPLAATYEVVTTLAPLGELAFSTQRRLLWAVPPGRHRVSLRSRGAAAALHVSVHRRLGHAEDLVTREEDLPTLLARAGAGDRATPRGQLLAAEALYQAGELVRAAAVYAELNVGPLGAPARALVEARRLALTPTGQPLPLPATEPWPGDAADELDEALVQAQLFRGVVPAAPSPALARRDPLLAAAALRGAPGQRAKSLEVLSAAVARSPLDEPLRERLQREWWSGARWAALPLKLGSGAWRATVLAPGVELANCAEARERGSPAYLEPATPELSLTVAPAAAPEGSLHRYHLLARTEAPALGDLTFELDGRATSLPLALPQQRLPFALAAGVHPVWLVAHGARVFVPCSVAPPELTGEALVEHEYAVLGPDGTATAPLFDPGTAASVAVELRGRPSAGEVVVRVQVDDGEPSTLRLRSATVDPRVVGAALGPAVQAIVPVGAQASRLTVTQVGGEGPVSVRLLVRRALGPSRVIAPRAARAQVSAVELGALRQATHAVQAARSEVERAQARVLRAELLLSLDQVTLGRSELELALPRLTPADAEVARALLAASVEPPLLPAAGAPSRVLAAAAGVRLAEGERACVDAALAQGQAAALRACPGATAAYFAGLLAEQQGEVLPAAQDFLRAFALSGAPAFAREAAQRLALGGPAHAVEALALATLAEQAGDADAGRLAARVRTGSRSRPVRAVEAGAPVRVDAEAPPAPSLRAALADVRWAPGTFLEMHPGKSAEFALQVERPLEVELEATCDLAGAAPSEGAPCTLVTDLDGQRLGDPVQVTLGATRAVAKVRLLAGSHRFHLSLTPGGDERTGFVRVATDRRLLEGSSVREDGRFILPIRPPPEHRFAATPAQPVRLKVQGPTLLRLEALFEPGEGRALQVDLAGPVGPSERRLLPACREAQEVLRASPPFDCAATLTVPLAFPGAFEVVLTPVGSRRAAVSLGLREPVPESRPVEAVVSPDAPLVPVEGEVRAVAPAAGPEVVEPLTLPTEGSWAHLGTLRVEQLGYAGGDSVVDPRVGDRFAETSLTYRQKVRSLPVWLMGSTWLHLHPRGAPLVGAEFLGFTRLPGSNLRFYLDARAVTERVEARQEAAVRAYAYVERSFEVLPRFYLLPRLAFAANTRTLTQQPALKLGDVYASPEVDPAVYSGFDQRRPRRAYAQLLSWWVPFVNAITYLQLRPYLAPSLTHLDTLDARVGFDVAFHTTEFIGYYDYQRLLPGELRLRAADAHRLALEVQHTLWLDREQRLGFRLGGRVDPVFQSSSFVFGVFWEGSAGRGLDDYSTPEVNLPDQVAQGRGLPQREESLR